MSQSICKIALAVALILAVSDAYALISEAKTQRCPLHKYQIGKKKKKKKKKKKRRWRNQYFGNFTFKSSEPLHLLGLNGGVSAIPT